MTNITLSIQDQIYKKMKLHSEIRWSELVRRVIQDYIEKFEILEKTNKKESIFTMLASEDVLKKDWDNKADERWNDV